MSTLDPPIIEKVDIALKKEWDGGRRLLVAQMTSAGRSAELPNQVISPADANSIVSSIQEQEQPGPKQLPPMTSRNPPRNLWRIVSVCLLNFGNGYLDAAPGALIPFIEKYYDISYSIVSLIWMSNAAGFIAVACLSHKIRPLLGRQKSLTLGCFFLCAMYSIVLSGTRFPVIVLAFFFGGIGMAITLAQANVFLAGLDKGSKYLSFCHGSYGVGASISPLLATLMVTHGVPWHYAYIINLTLALSTGTIVWFSFRGADEDLQPWDDEHEPLISDEMTPSQTADEGIQLGDMSQTPRRMSTAAPPKGMSHWDLMQLALKNYLTWTMALCVLFYQGSEVSMAGWIVTYLTEYRHGNPNSVGYVASGFWGGLTIGRLVVARPAHVYLGVRRSVLIFSAITVALVIMTWVLPNAIAAGVCVSLAGVMIGPSYILIITMAAKIIPRKIQIVSITIMTAFGSSGGAIFPFLVGLLSQSAGTYVVLPVFIALYTTMMILWGCLPNAERMDKGGIHSIWERIW